MNVCIAAIATSIASNAGVNIIKLSGSGANDVAEKIFYSKNIINGSMEPNRMYLGTIKSENFSERAFCVYYKMPKSYTGEDVIEFQCHGGRGIASAVLRLCIENGARPAEAGEFTKRAFLNGKLSLAEAEGVLEMINAQSEIELNQAYKLMSGELSKGIYLMEDKLLAIVASLEAKLDYPEEIEDEMNEPAKKGLRETISQIEKLLENTRLTKTVTDGINIAIIGLPNVGKSSLLNGLVMADRAIVTDIAGTTRDILSESIELGGIKLNLLDTAGIRESENEIEKIGIERTKNTINFADIVIFMMDLSSPVTEEEREIEKLIESKRVIRVANKGDISKYPRENSVTVKAKPPREIEGVKSEILRLAERDKLFNTGILTNERHVFCLKEALEELKKALEEFDNAPVECSLISIREGYTALAKITGNDVNESIVGEVFSTFCVGK